MTFARAPRTFGLLLVVAACAGARTPAVRSPDPSQAVVAHVARSPVAGPVARGAQLPVLLVHVDDCARDRTQTVSTIVRHVIVGQRYATEWPGGLPTEAALTARGARAYVVVPTVETVEVARAGGRARIECRIEIRVSPWRGTDGGERWEAEVAARATGTARVDTSPRDSAIEAGTRDCLREVAEQVTTHRVVPFLRTVVDPSAVATR